MLLCPHCKSPDLIKSGFKWYRRERVQQYRCNACGIHTIHPRSLNLPERDERGRFTRVALQKPSENENNKSGE